MTRLVALVGPTAAGKSAVALEIARRTGAEILSVDSMQVYRELDIGTAKPSPAERAEVVHHMIDVAEPEQDYTVATFRAEARAALEQTTADTVLIVGGSGLHFRSVLDPMTFAPYDPEIHRQLEHADNTDLVNELLAADPSAGDHVDLANPRRVRRAVEMFRLSSLTPTQRTATDEYRRYQEYVPELHFAGVAIDRVDPESAVAARLAGMRRAGFLQEVEALAPRLNRSARRAVGYRQLLDVVEGSATEDEGFTAVRHATMNLVKRQRTFFRRDPRLTWFDADRPQLVEAVMKRVGL